MKYSLGLDLGITSIGWALMCIDENNNPIRIADVGVRLFNKLEDDKSGELANSIRRMKRGQRRIRRRKQTRLHDFLKLFNNYYKIDFDAQKSLLNGKPLSFYGGQEIEGRKVPGSPYLIKAKGLTEPLKIEELFIALYHYLKYRGFKSNRKKDMIDPKDKGEKPMLNAIKANQSKLDKQTISQMIVNEYIKIPTESPLRIHNSEGEFQFSFLRDAYEKEIHQLLDKQLSLNVIPLDFKEGFLSIWNRQRHYSTGPGKPSPYRKESMQEVTGKCIFDNLPRAPKKSFTSESQIFLSALVNLRFRTPGQDNYQVFTQEQIQKIYEFALNQRTITYKHLLDIAGIHTAIFKGLNLPNPKKKELIRQFYQDHNWPQDKILPPELSDKLQNLLQQETLKINFRSLSNYHSQKSKFNGKTLDFFENPKETRYQRYDTLNQILYDYKSDEDIIKACKENGFSEEVIQAILELDTIEETTNLSINLSHQLVEKHLEGLSYDQAMEKLGYHHYNSHPQITVHDFIPSLETAFKLLGKTINNPNVLHMMHEARKVINAVIKRYGKPAIINVELSRDMSDYLNYYRLMESINKTNSTDRVSINQRQNDLKYLSLDRAYENEKLRLEMIRNHQFETEFSHKGISKDDLIRYKLYKEQRGLCAYSGKEIPLKDIFNGSIIEVDHIIPFSRSFDDSFKNKTLVYKSANQNKGNQTPYEFLAGKQNSKDWESFKQRLTSMAISESKRAQYLTQEFEEGFANRQLNDTRYGTKLIKELVEAFLQPEHVTTLNGVITDYLKNIWKINRFTHSLISEDLIRKNEYHLDLNSSNPKDPYPFIEFTTDSVTIKLVDDSIRNEPFSVSLKTKIIKQKLQKGSSLSENNEQLFNYDDNTMIKGLINYQSKVKEFLLDHQHESVNQLYKHLFDESLKVFSINHAHLIDYLRFLIAKLKSSVDQKLVEKNRDNHLHHALDAIVISCITPALIHRIMNFYREDKKPANANLTKEEIAHKLFPPPYENFTTEIKLRIYQRNQDELIKGLSKIESYKELTPQEWSFIQVVFPSRSPEIEKIRRLHQETYYGRRLINGELEGNLTKRISVIDMNAKDLENLVDKDLGAKATYQAIKEWLTNKTTQFPMVKNRPVKKITIFTQKDPSTKIALTPQKYVETDAILRVEIYKKQDDDRLYFAAINTYQLALQKQEKDISITLMWAQGDKNKIIIPFKQLSKEGYQLIVKFPRNS